MTQRWMRTAAVGTGAVTAAVLTLTGVAGNGASAAEPASSSAARTKLTFTVSDPQVKNVGKKVPKLGDRRTTSSSLQAGKLEAIFAIDCQVVRTAGTGSNLVATNQCVSSVLTDKGQFTAQGLAVGNFTPVLTLTGGSGIYEGAKGTLTITAKNKASVVTINYVR